MNLIIILPGIVGQFICLSLAIYILSINYKERINRLFSFLMFIQAALLFFQVRLQLESDPVKAEFWHLLSVIWPFILAVGYHLGILITHQEKSIFHRVSSYINYLTAMGFCIYGFWVQNLYGNLVRVSWGWEYTPAGFYSMFIMQIIWKYSIMIVILVYCLVYIVKDKNPYTRYQAIIFIIGFLFPTFFTNITRIIFPLASIPSPPLSNFSIVVGSFLVGIAVIRSDSFLIHPALAANTVFDSIQDGVLLCDDNLKIIDANKGAESIFLKKKEELEKYSLFDILPHYRWCCDSNYIMKKNLDIERDIVITLSEDKTKHLSTRLSIMYFKNFPVGTVCIIKDMTKRVLWEQEREDIREQLFRKMKLEAIGNLAGGIAHDFNTNIGAILLMAENLKADGIELDQRSLKMIDSIITSAEDAGLLTKNLLDFARKEKHGFSKVDLHKILVEIKELCGHTFPPSITLEFHLRSEYPFVYGNSQELKSTLLNICINARDAIETRGNITVSTRDNPNDRTNIKTRVQGIESPSTLCIEIRDSGRGMDESTRDRIFDPFFTTKSLGEGTGLGLSMAYGIIKIHDGRIESESIPGKGSVFKVFLPIMVD
ncbi:MAG: PAS domain-containing protein [Spirochaetales bacterium]|nr:PAS domain-containing protein [Spirochaetales bacterium]